VFVAFALLTWGFGEGLFFNFQPIYLKELGSDEQQIGLILGAFGAAMAITHIPAGRLADRIGRRPLLIFAWLTGLFSTIIMAFARDLPMFLVGMMSYGLTAFVSSPLASYVTAARGEWSVGAALSMTTATFSMGMALGPITGGWIGDHYGLRAVYFVAAGVFVISSLLILLIQNQPLDHHDPEAPPLNLLSNTRLKYFFGVVGFAVYARSDKQMNEVAYNIGMEPVSYTRTQELPRMETVMKNFVIYRWVEIALIVTGIVLIFLFRANPDRSFWYGLGITLAIQAFLMLGADFFAERRGGVYTEELENLVK